jgi:hypothetical protein
MEYNKEYNFNKLVSDEINSARLKHPRKTSNHHEAYAVILEELDEYWDEVKKKSSQRSNENMLMELVQTAAMCRRAAEDLLDVAQD